MKEQQHKPEQIQTASPVAIRLSPKELRFRIGVYDTYLRLRDGVKPVSDPQVQLAALQSYIAAFQQARTANKDYLDKTQTSNCKRFFNLYDSLALQIAFYYGQYLRNPNLSADTRAEMRARLYSLRLFESAMMSLVIIEAEGGRSDLDSAVRHTCVPSSDRKTWAELMLRTHQNLEHLHENVFGIESAMSPISKTSMISKLSHEYATRHKVANTVYFMGELAASIIAWDKAVSPALTRVIGAISIAPLGRAVTLLTGAAYAVGWVALDRFVHRNVSILKSADSNIRKSETLSSWERLIDMGEELVHADLNSPPLYYGYMKLLSLMEHQRTYNFLVENQWVLAWAEQHYGSVDAALTKLKEVFRHENPDHGRALAGLDAGGAGK